MALAVGELDHLGDVADEFDLEAILGRPNFHLIYEAAQQIQCLIAELRVPKRLLKGSDLLAVELGEVGMVQNFLYLGFGLLGMAIVHLT